MPAHALPLDAIPESATPRIISEGATHIVLAVEISKAPLIEYRRLFEQLIDVSEGGEHE